MLLAKYNYLKLFIFTIIFSTIIKVTLFANTPNTYISHGLVDTEFCNDIYVMASDSIYTSNDGENWEITFPSSNDGIYHSITVLNNEFIATGKNVQTIKSSDGINWLPIRLDPDIVPDKIHAIGKTYFWINTDNQLLYSYNLLTWNKVSMPLGQKFLSANFVNNTCFLSCGTTEYRPNYFVLSEDLTLTALNDISSIADIYYLNQSNRFVKLSTTAGYPKKMQIMTSKDYVHWEKSDTTGLENIDYNKFDINNIGGKLFFKSNDINYVSNDGQVWFQIEKKHILNTIKFGGKFFYSLSDSNGLLLSQDGMQWEDYPIDTKNMVSMINVYANHILVINPSFDTTQKRYLSKLYHYSIDPPANTTNNKTY